MTQNIAAAFRWNAEKEPLQTVLLWDGRRWTAAELLAKARQMAGVLQTRCQVQRGDRVGLFLKNRPEFIVVLLALWERGATAVPINCFFKPAEVGYILRDAGIQWLITESSLATPGLTEEATECQSLDLDTLESPTPIDDFPPAVLHDSDNELAVIVYTSGTTGRPKGAMLTHENLLSNAESCRRTLGLSKADRIILLLPMFHSFMLCVGIVTPLVSGCSILLVKSLHPVRSVLGEMDQGEGTILPAIPQFFRTLVSGVARLPTSLRLCVSGAAPMPRELLREFAAAFTIPLLEGYGLSEASPVVSMNPVDGPWKAGSVGPPLSGVEVSIRNDLGESLPIGETGEVCVRGRNVMLGYWNQPEATAAALREGWLYTGDIGRLDSDGYLYITDRKKEMLLVNGINVYPREIEEVIYQFPGVKEAAVIGAPDPKKGEQPVAFVSPLEGATIEERALAKFLRERLADYKTPRRIVILPALPRNATGKIMKSQLAAAP